MRERPVIFSSQMVKAILEGRKSQTCRIIKPAPPSETTALVNIGENEWACVGNNGPNRICSYGVAGDRLYIKETHCIERWCKHGANRVRLDGYYVADNAPFCVILTSEEALLFNARKRKTGNSPAIFMYRSLARIVRELTEVRAERLQDISEEDAIAEGTRIPGTTLYGEPAYGGGGSAWQIARNAYQELWDSLHGKGAWELNQWVWVLEFCILKPQPRM